MASFESTVHNTLVMKYELCLGVWIGDEKTSLEGKHQENPPFLILQFRGLGKAWLVT
jgi:hypothetical protein